MKRHTPFIFVVVLLFVTVAELGAQPGKIVSGISTDRLKRYETFIETQMAQGRIPGAVALIMRNDVVVHNKSYGYRDIREKTPMTPDDIFYIQSMTKPIITVAFMMLYEEGHFMLTDPVSRYIPDFKNLRVSKKLDDGKNAETEPLNRDITIAHLLTHTSGLMHGIGQSALDKEFSKEYMLNTWPDIKSRVDVLTRFPLVGQPGNQWYYSAAPDVLSVLIEHFSGMNTADFLTERIFKPLDMKNTGYNLSKTQIPRCVKVHSANSDGRLVANENQPLTEGNTIWSGVNGLFSTAADYMNFCQMLLHGGTWKGKQYLSRKTVELMTENHTANLFFRPGEGFGLGFAVLTDVPGSELPGSNGLFYWAGAFNTHFFIDPKEKLVSIFLTQTEPFDFYYHDKMRQLVYQAFAD